MRRSATRHSTPLKFCTSIALLMGYRMVCRSLKSDIMGRSGISSSQKVDQLCCVAPDFIGTFSDGLHTFSGIRGGVSRHRRTPTCGDRLSWPRFGPSSLVRLCCVESNRDFFHHTPHHFCRLVVCLPRQYSTHMPRCILAPGFDCFRSSSVVLRSIQSGLFASSYPLNLTSAGVYRVAIQGIHADLVIQILAEWLTLLCCVRFRPDFLSLSSHHLWITGQGVSPV